MDMAKKKQPAYKPSRRENEQRELAVLNWFLANPSATERECQKELESGRLTPGLPPSRMGIAKVLALKRQAEGIIRTGASQISARPMATEVAAPLLAKLARWAEEGKKLLGELPEVEEVRVSRAGAIMDRSRRTQEPL